MSKTVSNANNINVTKWSNLYRIINRTKLMYRALDTIFTVLDTRRWLFLLKKQFPFIF
jgi:hypothetical protein